MKLTKETTCTICGGELEQPHGPSAALGMRVAHTDVGDCLAAVQRRLAHIQQKIDSALKRARGK